MVNTGLVDTMKLLAQGVGVGAVIAFLFEKLGFFQKLSTEAKTWVMLAICLLVPVCAQLAVQLVPASTWSMLEPYWQALAAGFLIWAGSQGVHVIERRLRQ